MLSEDQIHYLGQYGYGVNNITDHINNTKNHWMNESSNLILRQSHYYLLHPPKKKQTKQNNLPWFVGVTAFSSSLSPNFPLPIMACPSPIISFPLMSTLGSSGLFIGRFFLNLYLAHFRRPIFTQWVNRTILSIASCNLFGSSSDFELWRLSAPNEDSNNARKRFNTWKRGEI